MTTCSQQSREVHEPLAGTAPTARAWIIVEQPGPWGRDALADAALPTDVAAALRTAKSLGVGVLLARHPDRLERAGDGGHHVWIACSAAGGMRLRRGLMDDLAPIARWDMAALAAGTPPGFGTTVHEPLLLVCTHSRRDQCCAVNGRALVTALLDAASPAQRTRIWECSHVGGHRLSPVTLALPSGVVHGRQSVGDADTILQKWDAGQVDPELLRGRSCFPAPLQAAEVAVRRQAGILGEDELDVLVVREERAVPVDLGWPVPTGAVTLEVRHRDGRAWRADVAHDHSETRRAESCGADPEPVHSWSVRAVVPAPHWG